MRKQKLKWPPERDLAEGEYTLYARFVPSLLLGGLDDDAVVLHNLDERVFCKGEGGKVNLMPYWIHGERGGDPVEVQTYEELIGSDMVKSFTSTELGLMDDNDTQLNLALKKQNDEELRRVYSTLDRMREDSKRFPSSEDLQLQVKFHEGVVGKFIEWYHLKGLEPPRVGRRGEESPEESNALPIVTTSVKKRLTLSPNDREKLNEAIVAQVQDYIDSGKGTMEQAFEWLSKKSKTLFGCILSKSQIEGRYKRNNKRRS